MIKQINEESARNQKVDTSPKLKSPNFEIKSIMNHTNNTSKDVQFSSIGFKSKEKPKDSLNEGKMQIDQSLTSPVKKKPSINNSRQSL